MVAQEILRSKLLQELSHTHCQLEISFVTATTSTGKETAQISDAFQKVPGGSSLSLSVTTEKAGGRAADCAECQCDLCIR